ncbi:unnamed protein product [Camellia sinensis]
MSKARGLSSFSATPSFHNYYFFLSFFLYLLDQEEMTETVIFNFASRVLEKIGLLALQEVGPTWGLEEELKTLEGTMSTIKAVLSAAETIYDLEYYSIVKDVWYQRLQAAFYEADNVLDEFQYEALRRHQVSNNNRSNGMQKLVCKLFSCSHSPGFRFKYRMSCKIEKIRKRLDMIADDRTKFHPIITKATEDTQTHHNAASTSLSSNVTDTALVKLLYNYDKVSSHFKLRIWVKVEQDFNVKHVMHKIIDCITDSPCADICWDQIWTILLEKLHAKRFLLVLDDLCNCDNRDWVKFLKFLTIGANGSKIIVTARYKSVASTVGTVPTYNLERLFDEDCHQLLLKWAGRKKDGEQEQHVNLSEIEKEIVKKCHRYPLAAKTLGNLLFMKTDENEWLCLKDKELWELVQNNKHDILPMLRFRMPEIIHDLAVFMTNEEGLSTVNHGSISISLSDSTCSEERVRKSLFTLFYPFQGVGASDKDLRSLGEPQSMKSQVFDGKSTDE